MTVESGKYQLISSNGAIAAHQVLFIGVGYLFDFGCKEIRCFAEEALRIISQQIPEATHIAMTIHGVGYGLDIREAFIAQLSGLLTATRQQNAPTKVREITIVELDANRAAYLKQILNEQLNIQSDSNQMIKNDQVVYSH